MAEGTLAEPGFVARLTEALHASLPNASIAHEQVRRDRYRFIIVDDSFSDLGHPERQLAVWKVAEAVVPASDIWNVAMIVTMAPSEMSDEENRPDTASHQ
jgi:hypothetical protein